MRVMRSTEGLFSTNFAWAEFLTTHWRKAPAVIRNAFGNADACEAYCYNLLKEVSELYGRRIPTASLEVFAGGRLQFVDVERYLPTLDEATYETYIERVKQEPGGDFLTIVLYNCQVHSDELFFATRRFIEPLIRAEGLPSNTMDIDIFAGEYEYTPSGIHFDAATNFSLVVGGTKKMVFWPPSDFPHEERLASRGSMMLASADVCARKRNSIVLQGEPGDIIYWPAGYWHMAVSSGWCTTLNIALYSESLPGKSIISELSSTDPEEVVRAATVPIVVNTEGELRLPERLQTQLAEVRDKVLSPALEQQVSLRWLKRVSASGFDRTPPMRDVRSCNRSETACRRAGCEIYIWPQVSGQLFIAANGHVISGEDQPWTRRLVATLNAKESISVDALISEVLANDSCKEEDVLCLLSLLYAMRALDFKADHDEGASAVKGATS